MAKTEDLIIDILENRPADAKDNLSTIMVDKLREAVERKKEEVAAEMFSEDEDSELEEKLNPITRFKQARRIKAKATEKAAKSEKHQRAALHTAAHERNQEKIRRSDDLSPESSRGWGYPDLAEPGETAAQFRDREANARAKQKNKMLDKANISGDAARRAHRRKSAIGMFGVKGGKKEKFPSGHTMELGPYTNKGGYSDTHKYMRGKKK